MTLRASETTCDSCFTWWQVWPPCSWFWSYSVSYQHHTNSRISSHSIKWTFKFSISHLCAVFEGEPPTPPTPAAQGSVGVGNDSSPFLHSVKRLVCNRNYLLLLVSYGINVGVFYAISTLLNQVSFHSIYRTESLLIDVASLMYFVNTTNLLKFPIGCTCYLYICCGFLWAQIILVYYPGREQDVGRIGLFIILAGMMGSVCCGIVLDKTHRFKWVKVFQRMQFLATLCIHSDVVEHYFIVEYKGNCATIEFSFS